MILNHTLFIYILFKMVVNKDCIYNKASKKSIPNDSEGNVVRLKLSRLTSHRRRLSKLRLSWLNPHKLSYLKLKLSRTETLGLGTFVQGGLSR